VGAAAAAPAAVAMDRVEVGAMDTARVAAQKDGGWGGCALCTPQAAMVTRRA